LARNKHKGKRGKGGGTGSIKEYPHGVIDHAKEQYVVGAHSNAKAFGRSSNAAGLHPVWMTPA
jgi:hypothetical protein